MSAIRELNFAPKGGGVYRCRSDAALISPALKNPKYRTRWAVAIEEILYVCHVFRD